MRWPLLAALALPLLLCAPSLSASNPRASGFAGARAGALAGAATASVEDCSAAYSNPANLGAQGNSWLCLDYSADFARLEPGGRSRADSSLHTVGGGLVARGKLFDLPFGVGAMLALPSAKLSRIEAVAPEDTTWVLDTNRPRVSFGAIGLGLSPVPALSLGVALHVLAGIRGRFDVSGALAQSDPYDSQLRHGVDADLASARSFAAAATWRASDALRVALVYRHRARVVQEIEGDLAGTLGTPPLVVPARYTARTRVTPAAYPSTLALSTELELGRALSLFAELGWEDFSEWKGPDESSTTSLLLAEFPADLGAEPPRQAKPAAHDRWLPRLGAEYDLRFDARTALSLRGGYAFERSPLPLQRTTRWLDADRHTFSAGGGLRIVVGPGTRDRDAELHLDAYGLVTLMPERDAVAENELGAAEAASGRRFGLGLSSAYTF